MTKPYIDVIGAMNKVWVEGMKEDAPTFRKLTGPTLANIMINMPKKLKPILSVDGMAPIMRMFTLLEIFGLIYRKQVYEILYELNKCAFNGEVKNGNMQK